MKPAVFPIKKSKSQVQMIQILLQLTFIIIKGSVYKQFLWMESKRTITTSWEMQSNH